MGFLVGKVAIVTGSSRGIGQALAERLGRDGANVVVTYAGNREKAEAVVSTIKANGSDAIALPLDLTKLDDIRNLFQKTIEQFGKVDILVISGGAPRLTKSIAETTEAEFDSIFTFNAKGNFFALQEAAKHLADNGRIVTFSTPYTVQPQPNLSVIAGSKAAIEAFTFALAKEVGVRGIRVNAIMPGPTTTDSFSSMVSAEEQEQLKQMAPLQRLAEAEDIANAVAFLVSDDSAYVTGHTLHATGGFA
ncbi:SDR family oxidoreductase [Leptolyngbya sp. NIES-2104]|uniref:SDR family oxidoreductase n=1 Tax=Leptolyngbya sp. NIES-2104 TaxID=1552121 RepID=UPI0006EC9CDB|nr:SDR family oxidoreductase [Leptolyngbya sp. NIES-2104]GAP98042.1 3-oxoacyl-[acyl-carrier protein] reductase [Leptolyngbya sp. NIES-2104]